MPNGTLLLAAQDGVRQAGAALAHVARPAAFCLMRCSRALSVRPIRRPPNPFGPTVLNFRKCFLLTAFLCSSPLSAQRAVSPLVGTWRIVEFCTVNSPGDTTYPLGRHPIGFFVYDAAGNVSIQAMRAAPSHAFTKDSVPFTGMAELLTSYFGYFGSYSITSDSTIVHHVKGGTIPSYVGTNQRRNVRFRGDTLSVGADEPWSCRKLVRER